MAPFFLPNFFSVFYIITFVFLLHEKSHYYQWSQFKFTWQT